MKGLRWLMALAGGAVVLGLVMASRAPVDAVQGEYSRIIHIHPPTAWIAFLAFGVTAAGSAVWLVTRNPGADRLAASSAEIGVIFTGLALVTGMIWGRPVWGRFWDWQDPRMATTAMMFVVYLGYLALRRAIDDPIVRARRSALLGIVAVVQVPLVYFSVNLWRGLHQTQSIRPDGATMPREMLVAMLVNVGAFSLTYLALLLARMRVARLEEEAAVESAVAGATVLPPRLGEVGDV